MAVRAVVLVCLILIVLPVFSDGPPGAKNADPNPEFFFTRVMYTDYTRERPPHRCSEHRFRTRPQPG